MADPASLGLGVVALAGLFNNAVDSYQYIRLGQQYARDFEINQTKLDLSRLQLSRWGEALGLGVPVTEIKSLPKSIASPNDIHHAEDALGNIVNLLDDARALSKRYAARGKPETLTMLDPTTLKLHQKISKLITQRQRHTSLVKKSAWALYGKSDLERLIGDIMVLTTQLVALFPATTVQQQQLSRMEVRELDDESLPIISEIANAQDAILAATVKKVMKASGHTYLQPHARDGAAEHNGDSVHQNYRGPVGGLSHSYIKPLAEGAGTRQHNGNVYGGASHS